MPEILFEEKMPDGAYDSQRNKPPQAYDHIRVSVVCFTPPDEEIFLVYSKGFEQGPYIRRPGDRPPSMRHIDSPWIETVDPFEQRLGTWFIQSDCKKPEEDEINDELKLVRGQLKQGEKSGMSDDEMNRLQRLEKTLTTLLQDAQSQPSYDDKFRKDYQGLEIIGQQGCGDLTMNLWYVAYIRSAFTKNEKVLIHLFEEPIFDRTYTCLVKWRRNGKVTIEEDVRLDPYKTSPRSLNIKERCVDVDDEVEFAVSGKPVIRNGETVDFATVVHQFSDMRHLFQLPNLNPPDGRPRFFFGRTWEEGDVWLGEKQLLDDRNLQRAAIKEAVILDRLYSGMGASEEQVRDSMESAGYELEQDTRASLTEGKWRFILENRNLIEVCLKPAVYPWGIIGVDEEDKHVLAFACNGHQGRSGYTLKEACNKFIDVTKKNGKPIKHALLMDEGNDVFQKVKINGVLEERIPLRRRRLRASFIFARKKTSN